MPSPQALAIQSALKQALLNKGFYKQSYDSTGALVASKTDLPDALQKLVEGWSMGDADWFSQWQQAQQVLIPSTSPVGTPSTGTLP